MSGIAIRRANDIKKLVKYIKAAKPENTAVDYVRFEQTKHDCYFSTRWEDLDVDKEYNDVCPALVVGYKPECYAFPKTFYLTDVLKMNVEAKRRDCNFTEIFYEWAEI